MLVHSCTYYKLHTSIISDDLWQSWANELTILQERYGHQIEFYDEEFKDWNGSTGYHLPLDDPFLISKCIHILRYHEQYLSSVGDKEAV